MKLFKSPNRWSCIPTSLAMLLSEDKPEAAFEQILKYLDHDGSEIAFPELPEPVKRKAFHIEEMQYLCSMLDFALVPYYPGLHRIAHDSLSMLTLDFQDKFNWTLLLNDGLLTGKINNQDHCVAWNAKERLIYDPAGRTYALDDSFAIDCFYAFVELSNR